MNTECTLNQLRGLMQLLRTDESDSSSDDDAILPAKDKQKPFGPGDINKKPAADTKDDKKVEIVPPACCTSIEPQSLDEWEAKQAEDQNIFDTRQEPEFTISYKQVVTTEDLYLGMSNKTPSTASCEDMILEIKLPGETATIDEMELTITENFLDLPVRKFKAKIALPHPVDPNKGKATYNAEYNLLKLVLRMNRELDFVNF
ncbi:LOW QUALITY PROTEIN: dynein axonemal assembly factor 6 [Culicoides brevitarsis]|uniref:LOW QUALITY PROTEIN: dynein axonemal assembly factor 6 n=1 Tax=Culicoides brevitarsis TaxID=469753 RepID=UPI00307B3D31